MSLNFNLNDILTFYLNDVYLHCLYIVYTLYIHCINIVYTLYIYCIYIVYTLYTDLKVLHFESLIPDRVERLLDGFGFSLDIVSAANDKCYYK